MKPSVVWGIVLLKYPNLLLLGFLATNPSFRGVKDCFFSRAYARWLSNHRGTTWRGTLKNHWCKGRETNCTTFREQTQYREPRGSRVSTSTRMCLMDTSLYINIYIYIYTYVSYNVSICLTISLYLDTSCIYDPSQKHDDICSHCWTL